MIGIYALVWEDGVIYIGQSINIHYRYRKHILSLRAGTHHNYKVQQHFTKYGEPALEILSLCKESELDKLEIMWIQEFNATTDGLNISLGGESGRGLFGTNSKYSKTQILKVFSLLYKSNYTYINIQKRTGVNIGVISGISNSTTHMWLEEAYPGKYDILRLKQGTRLIGRTKGDISYSTSYPLLVDPEGLIHNIANIAEFCRVHKDLVEGDKNTLAAVIRGDRKQSKGFRVYNGDNAIPYISSVSLIDTLGAVYDNITNISEFCRSHPLLCTNKAAPSNLSKVVSGARKQSMGFRLYQPSL